MKGEVIRDPDDGFIECQMWVKDSSEDIQKKAGFFGSTMDEEVEPEPGRKVLYVSW
jgi:hypothetical protein